MLSIHCSPLQNAFPRKELLHVSVPWFWWLPPRGHPLPASLVLSGASLPGPHETHKRRDHSHWLPPPGHCTASQLGEKKTNFFCEKGYCLSWSFSLKGRLLPWHTSGGPPGLTPGTKARGRHLCAFPLPHSKCPVSPGKELVRLSGVLIFYCCLGDTSRSPGSAGQGD